MRRREVTVLREGLKAWRSERKLTQKQLAERAGVSATLIALIESGERQPSLWSAEDIARALNVPLRAFALVHVTGDEDETVEPAAVAS